MRRIAQFGFSREEAPAPPAVPGIMVVHGIVIREGRTVAMSHPVRRVEADAGLCMNIVLDHWLSTF
jgi:hypothetical protein